jgi:DNA-binding MarR family transcriptional regulator
MDLDKRFIKVRELKQKSYARLVSLQKRFLDEWALEKLSQAGYRDFKMAYFPILMNIGLEGATNNELAEKGCVTKQATSKVIKELESYKLVYTELHETDNRCVVIKLTKKGKELVITAAEQIFKRMQEYEKLVGKENFQQAMDTMFKIMEYDMEMWGKKKTDK